MLGGVLPPAGVLPPDDPLPTVGRRTVGSGESRRASRRWWDGVAAQYQAEHAADLGDVRFLWGPEGLTEKTAHLLGPVRGQRILEVGCGAGQCARWLAAQGAHAVGIDISWSQLAYARALDAQAGIRVPVIQADAGALPFATASFDAACSAYGALPFIADAAAVLADVHRVLRPGGRWVFSVTHPIRWAFPDDPGPRGLTVDESYFDRTPYVEEDGAGTVTYAEHHRTLGDWVRLLDAAGFRLHDLVEPEWPPGRDRAWGQWSPLRGRLLPGTAIFVSTRAR